MTSTQTHASTAHEALRLWPGVAAVVLQWLVWFGLPIVMPSTVAGYISAFGAFILGLVVVVWWAFFSRASRSERWGAIGLMIAALAATPRVLHESIATGGQGLIFYFYALPILCLVLVLWAVASRRLSAATRFATLVATILVACGAFALLRTDGTSSRGSDFRWRWSETPEERLLAQAGEAPVALGSHAVVAGAGTTGSMGGPEETRAQWPGFRGPDRDGIISGVRIETDWSAAPPVELWRRPIGPGWSSFAVHGDYLYTQEQRGDYEVVACYRTKTGVPVWKHRDPTRFWESNAGAGPRATPTLSGGRVYSFGATGILNALEAGDGAVVWSRNVVSDTDTEVPIWGFSSSPLVVDDLVIVAAAGQLVAYDLATGDPRWFGPAGGAGYSSPHLLTIGETAQILLLSEAGAVGVAPANGELLWEVPPEGFAIVQPSQTRSGDVLIGSDMTGTRRVAIAHGPGGWAAEERWSSNRLKPYFSDFVVHEGHAYGFDGSILASVDLQDGRRQWKGGRYGHGQLVLLSDQDLLLVLTEKGELVLVGAAPDRFSELARFPAIEGKTWNHPALVDDILLVRNDQEMAAFRLSLTDG